MENLGLECEKSAIENNWVNHYVIYSPDLKTVIRDEFWRNREALDMSIKSIIFYAKDAFFVENFKNYKVYHIGVMNRSTLEYQKFSAPDIVYDNLEKFTVSKMRQFSVQKERDKEKVEEGINN